MSHSGDFMHAESLRTLQDAQSSAMQDPSTAVNDHYLSLVEHTRSHYSSSNDQVWLHHLLSSDAIAQGRVRSKCVVQVHYQESDCTTSTKVEQFGPEPFDLWSLIHCLASKYVRGVLHRDSSEVDPLIIDLLWNHLDLEIPFLRQHFDYKQFRHEKDCSPLLQNLLRASEQN